MRNSIELLAPAGNETALRAAVQSGANAVYIGGTKFGARHSAKNFTIEDIRKQVKYCHLYGVDVHVAVNTLIKEKELDEVTEYARALNDAGADALIIQDIGAARLIRKALPDMVLHASTQMTVTSLDGVKYLEDMGFSRVVLARELNKREIETICAGAKAEIEVFVHGAICMCYSGQCLMSSILGGRSGNRGRCAQPCRLKYTMLDKDKPCSDGYILSPRDMALIKHLKELSDIGVSSLKIEGRLKRAEYVSAVTGIYRKYLDIMNKSGEYTVSKDDMRELHDAFSRSGFTDGYFVSDLGKSMMSHKTPGNVNNTFSDEAIKRTLPDANVRKIPVNISGSLHKGEKVTISVFDNDGNFADAVSNEVVSAAAHNPIDKERFLSQISKTGSTPFKAEELYADIDEDAAIPIKEINFARREALNKLAKLRSERANSMQKSVSEQVKRISRKTMPHMKKDLIFSADVVNLDQGRAAAENGIGLIYAPISAVSALQHEFPSVIVVAKTDDIFHARALKTDCATVSSNAAIHYYKNSGIRLYGTHRLNIFNSESLENYRDMELVTLSPELRLDEITAISKNTDVPFEIIGYGRIPLMLMKNCPIRAMGKCQNGSLNISLRDRMGEKFPIMCHKGCIAELFNSKPLYMADKIEDLQDTGAKSVKLLFTVETPRQCAKTVKIYNEALNGAKVSLRENTFTRGHYYRGVE